jgi:DNA-binding LacI/PurR family transcriptional regulator
MPGINEVAHLISLGHTAIAHIGGNHDHELSDFFGLSTIAQFPTLQGRMAVDMLMDQLTPGYRDLTTADTPLPFELVVRSSTARPA